MYRYNEEDADMAASAIRSHVEEGQLHPYAGLMLIALVRGAE